MRMLDGHPAVICRGEGKFFGANHKMGSAAQVSLERVLLDSPELRDWVRRCGWTRRDDPSEWSRALAAQIARSTMTRGAPPGVSAIGDKTPLNGPGVVASIGDLLPDAPVIHIVRDGRDVATSSAHHRWNALDAIADPSEAVAEEKLTRDFYRRDPAAFIAEGRSIFGGPGPAALASIWATQTLAAREEGLRLGPGRYAEVRFESLLSSGPEELGRLLAFLGCDTRVAEAERIVAANRFEKMAEGRSPGDERSESFFRSGTAGGWREVFTPRDRETFRDVAGDALVTLGYERDGAW
jgi:hypothetical protein